MKQYPISAILVLMVILVLLDLYAFKGIKLITHTSTLATKNFIYITYWAFTLFILSSILITALNFQESYNQKYFVWVGLLVGIVLINITTKLVFSAFHGMEDFAHLMGNFFRSSSLTESLPGPNMDRRTFVTKLGLAAAFIPFVSVSYGMLKGKFNYKVFKHTLNFNTLPNAFDGLKIVQLSDLHLGSFNGNYNQVSKAIEQINSLNPDLILFTGDMVNNYAEETEGWQPVFEKLQARVGKYAILGNHDYGDYSTWNSEQEKAQNFSQIKNFIENCGFKLLLNENQEIEIDGEKIALIGVENWGKNPLKQYGDLSIASKNTEQYPFKILLSHDPTHWDAEVVEKTNIDLTLSGHTHGAQFGVEVGNIKWSPVKMVFPRWADLYTENGQYLYVNRGLGYTGFSGRVGISPEITLLELRTGNAA